MPCSGYAGEPHWMDGGEIERAKVVAIRAMVKIKNDSVRQSRALQALSQRVQDPAAEKDGLSADEKNVGRERPVVKPC